MTVPAPAPVLGRPRLHLASVDSTNARARALAVAGAPHGALVTAAHQSAGRGRQGRRWEGSAGRALLASLVLRDAPALTPLAAALAVAEVVGPRARIKWPNDVLLGDGKVAGILLEGRPVERWAVLGIGLNVALKLDELAPGLRARAATLGGRPRDVEPVLARLLAALERWLVRPDEAIHAAWRPRDALAGRHVAWSDGAGIAEGIDAQGRLLVRDAGGTHVALAAGEVHLAHSSTE